MGAGVGAVFTPPVAPPQPLQPRGSGTAAGTPSKLVAQELYWRWFQMADTGARACSQAVPPLHGHARPNAAKACAVHITMSPRFDPSARRP